MYLLLLFLILVVVYFVVKYSNSNKNKTRADVPTENDQQQSTFQIIYSSSNSIEANLIVSQLRQAGIESFLADDHIVAANPFLSNAVGGVKVKVYTEDYKNAVQALENYLEPQVECIFCHSKNTMKYYKSGDGVNGDFASFVELTPNSKNQQKYEVAYHCNDCERDFEL